MGGGGGRGRTTLGNIRGLVDKAREELRQAEGAQKRNVFLSFAHEDIDEVNLLRGQAKNEHSNIEFNDWSVREPFESSRADYIKQRIGERISQCSVTIVYVSESAVHSSWVNWEIEESIKRGKKVVGVYKGKAAPKSIPRAASENKVRVVPWSQLGEVLKHISE